jgi:hypothetical protein
MDRFTAYLRIPAHYAAGLRDLHWSAAGDAIEFGQGGTFAFPAEVFLFLEGFVSQRPLIHFGHILHLLHLLKNPYTPFLGHRESLLVSAFATAQRPYRNAGVFCALLCKDIPAVPDEPLLPFRTGTFELEVGASEPLFTQQDGEMPALPGEVFEARVLFELSSHSFEDILHWFRYGRGPVREVGEEIAQTVLLEKPRSLEGALADLAQRQRLSGAVPFVEQFVSALTLPPRRLERPELPLGGYSDVATRGQVEQLLPSQFAFDDLEFVRRHAERELLYFRREDPHVHTREDLVVVLDQGVRAWGTVRLVLTGALFALGRLARSRRLPFLVAATSDGGGLLDPLQGAATELRELIEASDLSAHPGAALERVLSEETEAARDIVLLTHPRNLAEPKVIAAARQLRPDARLFAVAVDEHGDVQFSAVRSGVPVNLSRFHVDLQRTAPPVRTIADPLIAWRGDVETVPYPFRFGAADDHKPMQFAFDAAGDWLLVATHGGMLYATRTDGSRSEILPRGLMQSTIAANVNQVIGVAGGFVVVTVRPEQVLALHYNFSTRTCAAHSFGPPRPEPVQCFYLRSLHTLVVGGRKTECLHLSTGSRGRPPAAFETLDSRLWAYPLPIQGAGEPSAADSHWEWPQMHFDRESGTIRLKNVRPAWEQFTPLSDNEPILKGCKLEGADCQGHTLAALFSNPLKPAVWAMLRLFQGPSGVPLAAFPQPRNARRFTLSSSGRLLAREIGRGRVEIRDVLGSTVPQHVTAVGRFHPQVQVELGDCWLSLRIDCTVHLAYWQRGVLVLKSGRWDQERVKAVLKEADLSTNSARATLAGRRPDSLPLDPGQRFGPTAHHHLFALVDRFGEVALFEPTGELVCMFFAFRQLAVWMPDGTCYGPTSLLGRPATPGALERIGAALRAASERGERTVV